MSATLTPKRKSARDRPASGKERVGDGGRESGGHSLPRQRCSWSEGPRAIGSMLTLPGGQCRILMPRGPSRQPARSCCILPLLSRLLALRPLPWRPLLLDAAGQAAAPVRTLHRHVLVARHALVPVIVLGLVVVRWSAALNALCSQPSALARPPTPPSPSCPNPASLPSPPTTSSTHKRHLT